MRCGNGLLLGLLAAPVSLAWSALPTRTSTTRVLLKKRLLRDSGVLLRDQFSNQPETISRNPTPTILTMSGGDQAMTSDLTPQQIKRRRKLSVTALLASAFLNLLGFTMAGPITPALGQHFDLTVGASFGSLTSAYPLGMLLGLFVWPQLSDNSRIGRKPVICASLLGSGLGLMAQAYVISTRKSLIIFLLSRVLTGCFAGSSPVSKAYLADVGESEGKLPRYLALRDAASTMAFIVGPLIGGLAFDARKHILGATEELATSSMSASSSLSFVIIISAAASLAAAALVGMGVTEDKGIVERGSGARKMSQKQSRDTANSEPCPVGQRLWAGVATVCAVSFLFNVGDSTFHAFFSQVMRDNLGLDARRIGLSYTVFACISFFVSATTASTLLRTWGPVTTCVAGLSAIGTGLLGLAASCTNTLAVFRKPLFALFAAGIYYCGVPLYGPTIPTMLLRCVPPNRRGAVMGLDGAINTVGRVLAPLIMGELYRRFGPAVTFGLAGTVVFSAATLALTRRLVVMRDLKLD